MEGNLSGLLKRMPITEPCHEGRGEKRRTQHNSVPKRLDGLRFAALILLVFSWFQGVPEGHEELFLEKGAAQKLEIHCLRLKGTVIYSATPGFYFFFFSPSFAFKRSARVPIESGFPFKYRE